MKIPVLLTLVLSLLFCPSLGKTQAKDKDELVETTKKILEHASNEGASGLYWFIAYSPQPDEDHLKLDGRLKLIRGWADGQKIFGDLFAQDPERDAKYSWKTFVISRVVDELGHPTMAVTVRFDIPRIDRPIGVPENISTVEWRLTFDRNPDQSKSRPKDASEWQLVSISGHDIPASAGIFLLYD